MNAIVVGKTESGVIFKPEVEYRINAVKSQIFTIPSGSSNAFCIHFVIQDGYSHYKQKEIGMFISLKKDDYKISNVYRQFFEDDTEYGAVTLYEIEIYYEASGKIKLKSNATLNRMIQSFEIGTLE